MGRKLDPEGPRAEQRRQTEKRVLDAAAKLFVAVGYGGATIRAIAREADVDPALVVHYFKSKQALFDRVTQARSIPTVGGSPAEVTEQILANLAESLVKEPVESLAVLRSMLTHPEAGAAARASGRRYEKMVSRAIEAPDPELRASLVFAVILGVIVSRHLVKTDTLRNASPEDLVDLLRPCLRELTGRKSAAGAGRPARRGA